MKNSIKNFYSKIKSKFKKITQKENFATKGIVLAVLILLVAVPYAYSEFQLNDPTANFGYGYGYNSSSGYGYGYGYGANNGIAGYGFVGMDGSATIGTPTQSGTNALVINYTTDYYAKNMVQYGIASGSYANSSQSAFETGSNSITISNLTCGVTYYYRIASEDAGGSTWYTSESSKATADCGTTGSTPPATTPTTTTGTVTATASNGGSTTLTSSDGTQVTLEIPAAAISADTTFTISEVSSSSVTQPGGTLIMVGGVVYEITAVSGGENVTSFDANLTLTFTYTDEQISEVVESALQVYYWDADTSSWLALTSTVDSSNNSISATTNHLTQFAIIGSTSGETVSGISEGSLIRAAGDFKVYIVKGAYKRWIQTADIFGCYEHLNFDAVQEVSSETRDTYSDSFLVRAAGDTKVYEINGDMSKHWLDMTAEQFIATGRTAGMISEINQCELDLYTTGADVNYVHVAGISNGSLIRAAGDSKVYIVKDTYKRWIQTANIFGCYGHLNFDAVQEVSSSTRDSYTDAWLIRDSEDTKVYEVNGDMSKHWLNMTAQQFTDSGRLWDMIYVINACETLLYTTGVDVCAQ